MDSWHSYPSVYALGHRAVADLLLDPVLVEEKLDGCVTPDVLVLDADLRYRPAGDLVIGQRLVGFLDGKRNKLMPTMVTAAKMIKKRCCLVITETRQIVASVDHPWLLAKKANNGKMWRRTDRLRPGQDIVSFPMWKEDTSWAAGHLAGFFDGEGTIVRHGNTRYVGASQVAGFLADKIKDEISQFGFAFSVSARRRVNKHTGHESQLQESFIIRGGWIEALRFLGTIRPSRLISKAESWWVGAGVGYLPRERVVAVELIGDREVVGLSTSTGTYVAGGMLCHNSQFSFGRFPDYPINDGLRARSKGAELNLVAPDAMFKRAVEMVMAMASSLREGWTYRAEYLMKPKHHTMAYDRIPANCLAVFDINTGHETYLSYEEKAREAARLGLEVVPRIHEGLVDSLDQFRGWLDTVSFLGGGPVEGLVVKNYARFGLDKKVLMGKFVSERFKETHKGEWRRENPTSGDILVKLVTVFRSPARWQKAAQHLLEAGLLEGSPRDIGLLIREVPLDVEKECKTEIMTILYEWAWPKARRGLTRGLAEWYKAELLAKQFADGGEREADQGASAQDCGPAAGEAVRSPDPD